MFKRLLLILLMLTGGFTFAKGPHDSTGSATAQYLANEGLMVVNGDIKVVFDPLFRNNYGQYQLLPR